MLKHGGSAPCLHLRDKNGMREFHTIAPDDCLVFVGQPV